MFSRQVNKVLFLAILLGVAGNVAAMSAEQLRGMLEGSSDDRPVAIDIRSQGEFGSDHIAGSLHISIAGLAGRNVPPFGKVVVVWDGVDESSAAGAVQILNTKPGIQAELLEGGFPAWSASSGLRGGTPGLKLAQTPRLSYAKLMDMADNPELAIIDLREGGDGALTDLGALLPDAEVIAPLIYERDDMKRAMNAATGLDRQGVRKRSTPNWLRGQTLDKSRLYVLVDGGDGRLAERVARRMQARGLTRVYMLTGGEKILRSGGDADLVTTVRTEVTHDE